jgi:hypothetical protein
VQFVGFIAQSLVALRSDKSFTQDRFEWQGAPMRLEKEDPVITNALLARESEWNGLLS